EAAGAKKAMTVSDMLARSEALVRSEYRSNPEHRAAVLDMLGMYYHTNGEDQRGEPLLSKGLQALGSSRDEDLRRELKCDHAMAAAALGKIDASRATLNAVIADPGTSSQQAALCLESLAYRAQDANAAPSPLKSARLALQRLRN